jgi:hypothetical protein
LEVDNQQDDDRNENFNGDSSFAVSLPQKILPVSAYIGLVGSPKPTSQAILSFFAPIVGLALLS